MRIYHNIAALNTYRQLSITTNAAQKNMGRLSSGLRINSASDDAAGLAISEKMRAQIRGLDQAARNAQDGISMVQTAEGALNETHSILQRMRELADQAVNSTNTDADRAAIQVEVKQLREEIDRIGDTTQFNGIKLLNGSLQSNGAVTGANVTTSAQIATLASATITGATAIDALDASTATWGIDTFNIDGHQVQVNWDTILTNDEKNLLKQDLNGASADTIADVKEAIERGLNQAIDNYNADNSAGATVGHINIYLGTGADANKLVLESSVDGTESKLFIDTSAATTVGALFLSNNAGADSSVNTGTAIYKNASTAATDTIQAEINGIKMNVTLDTGALTQNTTSLATVAFNLQTDINDAITQYNTDAGLSSGDEGYIEAVKVTTTNDGRLVISSNSGPITFNEAEGETLVERLGLTLAQTEAGGAGGLTFQIGANRNQTIVLGISDMRTSALGISGVDVSTKSGASAALDALDKAITKVSSERSKMGAIQNRLEYTINNLNSSSENLVTAESRIRDVDMAKEMMEFTKNNILSQAAQAMLAQANQQPQQVLQLLR